MIPFAGYTANDVITGPSYGGEAYFGGGGGVTANGYGVTVSGGFGLSVGLGATLTAPGTPNTTSQTVEMPVYDAMGNATGFTTTVANPMYSPAAEAAQLQGQADQAGANVASIQNMQQMANTPTYDGSAQFPAPPAAPANEDGSPAASGTPTGTPTDGAPQAGGASGTDPENNGAAGTAAAAGSSGQGNQDQSNVPIDNSNGDFGNQTGGTNSGAGGSGQNDNTYGDFGDGGSGGGGGGGGGGGDGGDGGG